MTAIDQSYRLRAVNCGRRFGEQCNAAYELLSRLDAGLCVDVGAAIGRSTRRILLGNPASRVIAYEPFAGNQSYFKQAVGDDARVTLRPMAVADRAGTEPFTVPSVVKAGNAAWTQKRLGYSALGHLGRGKRGMTTTVDVVALDDEIREPVRFLKIDVQGGELRVLNGASRLIKGAGIDLIYIEFNGSLDVLRFLHAHRYVMFDCAYMAWPTRRYIRNWLRRRPDRFVPGWRIIREGPNSMGSKVVHVWPHIPMRAFEPYCVWFFGNRLLRCGLQTDLLCVHESFLPQVWRAMR